ncbi:MAG: hypothetical protein KGN78_10215 [Actinomycetales bacterium]|nr:hypothetical protein [Actinomycetales bacterium]
MTSRTQRHVVVFHPEGNADNNPVLHAWLQSLQRAGYRLTVIARTREHQHESDIYKLRDYGRWYSKLFRILVDRLGTIALAKLVTLARFPDLLLRKHACVVGVDRHGLVQAWSAKGRRRLGFLSFEIEFEDEVGKVKKSCERRAARDVDWWMSQDEMRASILIEQNQLRSDNYVVTPVAPSGRPPKTEARLRDDLGIPRDVRVVMSMGSLARWTKIPEILESVNQWPDGWVLLVHERYSNTESALRALSPDFQRANNKIFLSSHRAVSPDDLAYVLAGIDCGLAFYQEEPNHPLLGKNLRFMGRSSGKVATFARHAVPVVTNLTAPVSDDIFRYNAGCRCESPADLPKVLSSLDTHASATGAQAYFDEVLDFDLSRESLLRLLEPNA